MTFITRRSDLPSLSERRLAVRVTNDALRQIRAGHPWVFDGSVTSVSHPGSAGDLAVVFDAKRRFAAIGLFDPDSPIRIRVLHTGSPRQVDGEFWIDRVGAALDRRSSLAADPSTTGYRCVHGENDGLPGLVIDRYAETAVVKIYTAAWLPHLDGILDALVPLTGVERVVLRGSRAVQHAHGPFERPVALVGELPVAPVEFSEHGLRFGADVVEGQKTGHFLDQRENRIAVGELASEARVLDVFCCTGGFSVHAAAGGAAQVHSVDLSQPALDTAIGNMRRNHDRRPVAATEHRTTAGDAFDVLETLARRGERYDVVVIDPPSFASRADQVDRALAGYGRLTALGLDVVRPGGMLVQSSCSSRVDEAAFHATIRAAATESGRSLVEWRRTTHPVDHPIGFPEGAYLKSLFARVDP